MKKFAHEVQIGDKIDWYGHGEYMEFGTVIDKSYENSQNIVVLTIDDKSTYHAPFIVRKLKYSSIEVN